MTLGNATMRLAFPLLLLCSGCSLLGGLRVESLGTASQRPSNVAAYVAVSDGDEPIPDLTADDFTVYENGQALPKTQTQQTLLERELVALHRTLLLVDLSGATTPTGRQALAKGVSAFLDVVRPTQAVTVYAFAGGTSLRLLGEYPRSGAAGDAFRLADLGAADASRNLNGAVKQALKELDARLALIRKPIRVGTLVVFAAGPDVAGRVSDAELDEALGGSKAIRLAIGAGPDAPSEVRALGPDGFVAAQSADALPIAFEEAAYKVRSHYEKHYLLSYCSPARAGSRRLRLEARFTTKDGTEKTGDVEADFDARGFGPGCNSRTPPRFATERRARESSSPDMAAEPAAPETESTPAVTPVPDDDGSVVPPPDRPGYAK